MTKVMMYTLSTCPWCKKTKQWFNDRNIPFDFVDYDKAEKDEQKVIQDRVRKENLTLSFPIVYIDDKVIQGYSPDKYDEMMSKK
ncbi:MAG: glutaredoxin 3 [Methanomassiliicoccales archaeon PtaU1.Bin124]|nr:MAG: glutaredoxin 3 [Methanomassiliicoccales archaeon PtaU1.Bin124]